MAIIVKYDKPVDNTIAPDSNYPSDTRNMARMNHTFATASGQVTFDASYPTGGYAASPAKFGLSTVAGVLFEEVNGYAVMYNRTTDKIQVYSTAGTEVTAATNLSALQPVYFEAKGLV